MGQYLNKIIQAVVPGFLVGIADASADLVFADPPFNLGKAYNDRRDNYKEWCAEWIVQCFRILKDTGSFYLMTLPRHLEWKMPIMAQHGIFINLITWRNVSASHGKRSFWGEYQPIMLYGKTDAYKFNTYAEVDRSPTEEYAKYRKRWGGYCTEYKGQIKDRWGDIPFVYAGSIKHPEAIIQLGTNKKAHPCQMPEGLAKRAVIFSTDPGDVVLDPFCGSGTVPMVCRKLGRGFIAIEEKAEFCQIARDRIAGDLFTRMEEA